MKKQFLILLLSIITLSAFGQAGSYSISVLRSRVNDSTTVNGATSSGYGFLYWNNDPASGLTVDNKWKIWDGTAEVPLATMFSTGGNFWKDAGTTNLTGNTNIDAAAFNLNFLSNTGSINLENTDGGTSIVQFNVLPTQLSALVIDGSGGKSNEADFSVAGQSISLGLQESVDDDYEHQISIEPDGLHFRTGTTTAVDRLQIDVDGSWDLAGTDPGTAGYVLQSNGAGAAPTWVAPSGGGPGSWVTLTDGSTVNWDTGSEGLPNAVLTSTQSFTLNQTNVSDGSRGVFKLVTNTASAIVLTFDTDFTNLQLGGNGEASSITTYTFPAATAQTYLLTYVVHGTTIYWSGFVPQWTAYTPSVVGVSSPTINARYLVEGNKCTVVIQMTAGTGSTTGFTISAPVTSANTFTQTVAAQVQNNGTFSIGSAAIQANTAIFDINLAAGGAWIASGNRKANFVITYEIP